MKIDFGDILIIIGGISLILYGILKITGI